MINPELQHELDKLRQDIEALKYKVKELERNQDKKDEDK